MLNTQDLLDRLGATRNAKMHPLAKIQETVDYIAENMEGNENDEQKIFEIVFAARKNIAETVLHGQTENRLPHTAKELVPRSDEIDVKTGNTIMSMFLLSPETILKVQTEGQLVEDGNEQEAKDPAAAQTEADKKKKYAAALKLLSGKEISFAAYDSARGEIMNDKLNVIGYLKEDLPGEDPIADAFNACKPGFAEKWLRRTSREYTNFKNTFEARMNGAATRDELDNAAKAYLMRKIPGYNGEGLPKMSDIARLGRKSRNRALLCFRTLQASTKSRGYEKRLVTIQGVSEQNLKDYGATEAFNKMRFENSNIPGMNEPQNEQQAKFQNDLKNSIQNDAPANAPKNDNNIIQNPVAEENLIK